MVIEKLRANARRQAAAQSEREAEKLAKKRSKRPFMTLGIVSHKVFVPALAIWGAALCGLGVMLLHSWTITRIAMFAGLGALGSSAQIVLALIAAVIGGIGAFVVAVVIKRVLRRKSGQGNGQIATMAARRVRPIDPVSELGSESLDSPLEEMPFAPPSAKPQGEARSEYPIGLYDDDDGDDTLELDLSAEIGPEIDNDFDLERADGPEGAGSETVPAPAPRALDLAEFSQMPGRNAVWIEEPPVARDVTDQAVEDQAAPLHEPEPVSEPAQTAGFPPPLKPAESGDSASAIDKLREVPPQDLSLVQMVERFAAALYENQEAARKMQMAGASTARARNARSASHPPRDAALAEALKALSLFTERGFDVAAPGEIAGQPINMVSETERELRNALEKLQNLRGAA